MPRHLTIACDHCGFRQLKRDTECEACGRMTRRERNRWIAKAVQLGVILLVGAFMSAETGARALFRRLLTVKATYSYCFRPELHSDHPDPCFSVAPTDGARLTQTRPNCARI